MLRLSVHRGTRVGVHRAKVCIRRARVGILKVGVGVHRAIHGARKARVMYTEPRLV